jgi:CubicO group peptidase (beta-lactamase class C family)
MPLHLIILFSKQNVSMKQLIICLLVLLLACDESNKPANDDLQARINRIENNLQPDFQIAGEEVPTYNINDRLKELGIPGLSMAMVVDGKIEWAKAYGMADVADKRPANTETLFLAGSISKPIAALRAHQLVESETLTLDGNVNDYLTSWQLPENEFTANEKVTLRRILNHTAGLTVWGFPGYDKGDTIPSVQDVLDGKGNTDAVRVYKEPGESWRYSGGGYTIMQLMITDTKNLDFPTTMKDNVLVPLGMTESTFENPLPEKYHAIAATGYRSDGEEVEGKWPIYPEMAAAGLWTTPSQLIQYAIEIQNISQNKSDGLLQYATVEEMLTPGMNDHGLGPGIGEFTFGHGGADEGFRAQLTAWKEQPTALVIMVNSDNGKIMRELMLAIAAEYDLPGFTPNIKHVIDFPSEELTKYVGAYEIDDVGPMTIQLADGVLEVIAEFIDEPVYLLSQSDTLFFDRSDGTSFDFEIVEDKVTGFMVRGYKATRSDN